MEPAEIPYVDFANFSSPYYTERHKRWRKLNRDFAQKFLVPSANKWEKKQKWPLENIREGYRFGIYAYRYPAKYGGTPFEGIKDDPFMQLIQLEEFGEAALPGVGGSIGIHQLCVPPVLHFGKDYHKRLISPVIRAEKMASLCISESKFGSDVANLETTAVRSDCGKYFIVNGEKKWISAGTYADFFITAVRTGGPKSRHKGISLLIIERSEGVTSFRIPMQGMSTSSTSQIFFKDVKVPVENLLGKENKGFYYIMFNFNQERFAIICIVIGQMKKCLREAIDYARKRKVFGKPLVKSQVIRHKIAEMARVTIASRCFAEQCAFQMMTDPMGMKDSSVGANIALCKVQCTRSLEFVAREASQILGGKSYVLGNPVDRIFRGVRGFAIYGGSEEIMLDASTRLAKL